MSVTDSANPSVRLLFFGRLADCIHPAEFSLPLESTSNVKQIFERVAEQHPELAKARSNYSIKAARNQALCDWETEVNAGDEIAFLPPVTGG